MILIDAQNELTALPLLASDSRTASSNGTGVDLANYHGVLKVTLDSEAGSGTSPTLDVKIQDSADNSSWDDVSGYTFTQVTDGAAAFQSIGVDTRNVRRYVRAVGTIGGSDTPTFVYSVSAVGQMKRV